MHSFPRVLREIRRARQMTQKALADAVSKTPAYIAALEVEDGQRGPSLSTLRDLTIALASTQSSEGDQLDFRIFTKLIVAALDIEVNLPEELEDSEGFNKAVDVAEEVWVISSSLAEAKSLEDARRTSEKIGSGAHFVFLVPANTVDGHIHAALDNIRAFDITQEVLEERVTIFRVSGCAFPISAWILDPRGTRPQGFYHFGYRNLEPEVRRMASYDVSDLVRTYSELCSMFHVAREQKANREVGDVGRPDLGFIGLAFPLQGELSALRFDRRKTKRPMLRTRRPAA